MITLELVDQIRKRTNCSYEEAKFYLEKHNGDVLEAIVDFEKNKNSTKSSNYNYNPGSFDRKKQVNDIWQSVCKLVRKGFEMRVVIEDNNSVIISIPVNIFLLLLILASYIVIPIFLILLLLRYRISIREPKGEVVDISSVVQNVTGRNTDSCQNVQNERQDIVVSAEEPKNDFNETTIE